jgi:hypothetical protein
MGTGRGKNDSRGTRGGGSPAVAGAAARNAALTTASPRAGHAPGRERLRIGESPGCCRVSRAPTTSHSIRHRSCGEVPSRTTRARPAHVAGWLLRFRDPRDSAAVFVGRLRRRIRPAWRRSRTRGALTTCPKKRWMVRTDSASSTPRCVYRAHDVVPWVSGRISCTVAPSHQRGGGAISSLSRQAICDTRLAISQVLPRRTYSSL